MIYGSFHIFNYLDWDHFILNQALVYSESTITLISFVLTTIIGLLVQNSGLHTEHHTSEYLIFTTLKIQFLSVFLS